MKKIFLFLLAVALFAACDKYKDYDDKIEGVWMCQEINNLIVPTNNAFVLNVGGEKVTTASIVDTAWLETTTPYMLEDDRFNICGGAYSGEYQILYLSDTKLRMTLNNINYTLYKENVDFATLLSGNWQGNLSGSEDIFDISFQNGEFLFDDGNNEVSGTFRLYGELMVVQYLDNGSQKAECWLVEKQDNGLKILSYNAIDGTVDLQAIVYNLTRK